MREKNRVPLIQGSVGPKCFYGPKRLLATSELRVRNMPVQTRPDVPAASGAAKQEQDRHDGAKTGRDGVIVVA